MPRQGEALIQNISVQEVYEQAQYWHRCSYTVLKSPRITVPGTIAGSGVQPFVGGFEHECILDAGARFLDPNGNPQPIRQAQLADGRACRLDGHGHLAAATTLSDMSQAVYLQFRAATSVDFDALNLVPPY